MHRRDVLKTIGAGAISTAGVVGSTGSATADSSSSHFHNPTYPDKVFPDPTVIRASDGTYYAYGSNMEKDSESQEEMVPIVSSTDLVNWTYEGEAFTSYPDWRSDDASLWAPDINYYNGQYYLYYSYSVWGSDQNPGIGLATSDTPTGPFTDQGPVMRESEIGLTNCIDPEFRVVDGTPYMIWGSFYGIHGVELTSDGTDFVSGTTFHLVGDDREGAWIYEANGYYYLFYSTGYCCEGYGSSYELEVGRSTNFTGPYYNQNGTDLRDLNSHNSGVAVLTGDSRFPGPGHGEGIVDDAGDLWFLHHAYDRREPEYVDGTWNRIMFTTRVRWDDNDWPVFGCDGVTPTAQSPMPHSGSYSCQASGPITEGVYHIRNVNSGKLLEVGSADTSDGANIQQWSDSGCACQDWRVTDWGNGEYALEAMHSGKLAEVADASTSDGANVQQWPSNGHPTQRWFIIENSDGTYRLENVNSGKVMDVEGGSTSDGGDVIQWGWWGGDNQKWTFEPV
ncbi:MAG: RICIN domain-containing protein [Haloarculaceae archaeon]